MRKGWSRARWWQAALVAVLIPVGALSLHRLDSARAAGSSQERLYFPTGRFLREATCGFREVAADFLWFETVQYYGGFRKGEHDLRYFDLLIDGVTTLDPRFFEAFYFSSLVKGLDFGQIDEAVEILRRGIIHNPENASLHFNVGFMYYVFEKDFERASVWFDAAARTPTANDFIRRFAAYAKTRAGQLEASLALWENLRATAINPDVRALAERMVVKCQQAIDEKRPSTATQGGES